ncbi:MAG: hypothetical protein HY652_10505 [Acidobacteria bacterium]|nr:hypothetical protein [Acidobacteriota bacterium]
MELESRGLPTAVVVTAEFLDAGAAQANLLGATSLRLVPVQHPIQNLVREELRQRADAAFEAIVKALTK